METSKPADFQKVETRIVNAALNANLQTIDATLRNSGLPAMQQMGILMIASAVCFRRILEEQKITDRGRRKKLQKIAMEELGKKIAEHGFKAQEENASAAL